MPVIGDTETVEREQELVGTAPVRGEDLLTWGEGVLLGCRDAEVGLRVIKPPPAEVFVLAFLLGLKLRLMICDHSPLNIAHLGNQLAFLLRHFKVFHLLMYHGSRVDFGTHYGKIWYDLSAGYGQIRHLLTFFFFFLVIVVLLAVLFFFGFLLLRLLLFFFFVVFFATVSRSVTLLMPDVASSDPLLLPQIEMLHVRFHVLSDLIDSGLSQDLGRLSLSSELPLDQGLAVRVERVFFELFHVDSRVVSFLVRDKARLGLLAVDRLLHLVAVL